MNEIFPFANKVAGLLILLVGFVFHWVGQLISVISWDRATQMGLQEKGAPPEYKVYEHGIAVADVAIAWVYGVAGIGLLVGATWAPQLAWVPAAILPYHAISAWFWSRNQKSNGHPLKSDAFWGIWCGVNMLTGALALAVAWTG